jgi:hypothetical protein
VEHWRGRNHFIPAQLAHQLARKLQARRLGTVAVF